MTAPVLPALTNPSTLPSRTRRAATRIEESRFSRNAFAAASSMVTASLACTTSMPSPRASRRPSSRASTSWGPTSTTSASRSRAARIAPSTSGAGAASVPIASTAIRRMTGAGSRCPVTKTSQVKRVHFASPQVPGSLDPGTSHLYLPTLILPPESLRVRGSNRSAGKPDGATLVRGSVGTRPTRPGPDGRGLAGGSAAP